MGARRVGLLLVLVAVLSGGLAPRAAVAEVRAAEDVGGWTPVASPSVPVEQYSAGDGVTLANGQVLFITFVQSGGFARRFDPATASWIASAPPPYNPYPTSFHVAALADGRALLLTGDVASQLLPAFLYDPASDTWAQAASPTTGQIGPFGTTDVSLIALADGRALALGAFQQGAAAGVVAPWAEIYDPAGDRWSPTATPGQARTGAAIVPLADGRVLLAGGSLFVPGGGGPELDSVVRFDPATGQWAPVASLSRPRSGLVGVLLADGQVLALGGAANERYDPVADRWSAVPAVPVPVERGFYDFATATALPNGRVLVVGGTVDLTSPTCDMPKCARSEALAATALYDATTNRWQAGPPSSFRRWGASVSPLLDGRVLVVGGDTTATASGQVRPRNSAEIYEPVAPAPICFAQTGQCVGGRLRQHWLANGGLAVNGYPLSGEFTQRLEDGKAYTVQYFERVRLELHPENSSPYDVLLGQFGRQILAERVRVEPAPSRTPSGESWTFRETGHTLFGGFLTYWEAHGGLAQFGYPLTEVFKEKLENGQEYEVQYFERARFEYHPENPAPYDILLGQFGRPILAGVAGR